MNEVANIFSPHYNRKHDVHLAFILRLIFWSRFKTPERRAIYFLFGVGKINLRINNSNSFTKDSLLHHIFDLTQNRKIVKKAEIRGITGLSKDTFNKYFRNYLQDKDLTRRKIFTFSEVYSILEYWQGDEKWGRMKAFTKNELSKLFTDGSYEELEINMTNEVMSHHKYKSQNKIAPKNVKQIARHFFSGAEEKIDSFYNEHFNNDYLTFFLGLLIWYFIKDILQQNMIS
ncbi:hypothetical protein [Kordia sp.]|uniref:hypothetical protein n=1 Tax=Kordia sp. TaxID=1965332 RepID=UPI003D287A5B